MAGLPEKRFSTVVKIDTGPKKGETKLIWTEKFGKIDA
jgi:hypothetical protein